MALYTASIITVGELSKTIEKKYRVPFNKAHVANFTINAKTQDFDGYNIGLSEYFDNVTLLDTWLVQPTVIGIYKRDYLQSFAVDTNFTNDNRGEQVEFFHLAPTMSELADFTDDGGNIAFRKDITDPLGDNVITLYEFYEDYSLRAKNPRRLVAKYIKLL